MPLYRYKTGQLSRPESWTTARGALDELRALLRIVIDSEGRPLVRELRSEDPSRFGIEIDAELGPNIAEV